ncbi:MAG: hypothetical protein HFJ59_04320 [Clostridia bacterium]|nr:hypothetical protein [Clostridia bacterium]
MIDTKIFYLIDAEGYQSREIADTKVKLCYSMMPGIKIQYDEEAGQHYIVQKRKRRRTK